MANGATKAGTRAAQAAASAIGRGVGPASRSSVTATDAQRARRTFTEPKTGLRKGTTQTQSQTSGAGPSVNPTAAPFV